MRWIHAPILLAVLFFAKGVQAQLLSEAYSFPTTPTIDPGPGLSSTSAPAPVHHLTIPASWSYDDLGMFCKLDVQFERHLGFPVLFRLGDVQQVEAWEDKGPLRLPARVN